MDGPRITDSDWTEDYGVLAVQRAALEARCVWRPTATRDVGIDGQLEHVLPDGVVSGRIVAVQIKSGPSYWTRRDGDDILVTPHEKHRVYWARHPLPVILVLHHEAEGLTIWADARAQLRAGATTVRVSRTCIFDAKGVHAALAADGPVPGLRQTPDAILAELAARRHPNPGFRLSFLDLFAGGMTDVAHTLYFGMDLVTETQDVLAVLPGGNGQISIGEAEFAFLDDYVSFLIARDIARVDFDAWQHMKEQLQMVGAWICPLTATGRELVERVHELHPDLYHGGLFRERYIRMELREMDERVAMQQELARRLVGES